MYMLLMAHSELRWFILLLAWVAIAVLSMG